MATISKIHRSTYSSTASETSAITRFLSWCEAQEDFRYIILIVIIMIQGNILIPATLFSVLKFETVFTGLSVYLTGASTLAVLVTNLAQVPMKVVIPAFLLNVVLLISLILIHLLS